METKMLLSYYFLAIFAASSAVITVADVVGCGGFVQASQQLIKSRRPEDPKLDYSNITVELQNEEGLVKDSTQCAPNGYYFLPLYHKGSFVLTVKGPDGWIFEPYKVPVVVGDTCNNDQDVNFKYTGFTLSGQIPGAVGGDSCQAAGEGPAGIVVTLTPVKPADGSADEREERTILTTEGGFYSFADIIPGEYAMTAWHHIWTVGVTASRRVHVGWGSQVAPKNFQVAGYNVGGTILAQGNPVLGVQVFLYSEDVKSIPCGVPKVDSPIDGKEPLCHTQTGPDGKFWFDVVPCGNYIIIPLYRGEATIFGVSPDILGINIGHAGLIIEEPFQVTGFSVIGRVVDSEGLPVGGASVLVDGTPKATTDSSGSYTLDQVSSQEYTISAKKAHYVFAPLEKFQVLPNLASLPDIVAREYDLCGKVTLDGAAFAGNKRQVALTDGPEAATPQSRTADKDGRFCFQVPPGNYRVTPIVSPVEVAAGLVFAPAYLDSKVSNKPVVGVSFRQGSLAISGQVRCLELCDSSITLTLVPKNDPSKARVVALGEDSELFSFTGVTPGKYSLVVKKEPPKEIEFRGDEWCWDSSTRELEVTNQDVTGVAFEQRGWLMRVNSTHPENSYLMHDEADPLEVQLQRGVVEVCLQKSGTHMMIFLYPCIFFGALMYTYDTSHPEPLQLIGQKYLLEGEIHVDSRVFPHASNLTDYLYPTIWKEDGTPVDQRSFARIKSKANETHPVAVYEYAHWAEFGDRLEFRPRHNGLIQEEVKMEEDYAREMDEEEQRQKASGELGQGAGGNAGDPAAAAASAADGEGLSDYEQESIREQRDLAQRRAQQEAAGVKPKLKDLFEEMAVQNPAVLGKEVDLDEFQAKQRALYGAPAAAAATAAAAARAGTGAGADAGAEAEAQQGDAAEGAGEEEDEVVEMSEEDKAYYAQAPAIPVDPYEHLPMEARPLDDPDADDGSGNPVWPPLRKFLFYPRSRHVSVEIDGCQPPIPVFEGRPGVYLEGSVSPPLKGVNVTVVAKSDSETGGYRAGDAVLSTLTQAEGLYIAGPLYDDATYGVTAFKEGYEFQLKGEFSFESQKLGSIHVSITAASAAAGATDLEEVLPPVLLSLSGDKGYRQNSPTPPGGAFAFHNLYPGSFYLRPVLKEYSFTPAAQAIELGSGQSKEVTFRATRVAFSVTGSVSSLSGQPEDGVPLEARSASGLYEQTTTGADGRYRIRGLVPGVAYSVQVVLKNGSEGTSGIERASPTSVSIQVDGADATGVDFLAFDQPAGITLSGTVEGPDAARWRPNISVEVAPASEPARVVHSSPLPISHFFEIRDLPRGRYIVRLRLSLPERTHEFRSEPVEANLEYDTAVHVGALRVAVIKRDPSQELRTASVLPMVVVLAVIALFAGISTLKDGYQWVTGTGSVSGSQSPRGGGWVGPAPGERSAKKEAKRSSLRKRTF